MVQQIMLYAPTLDTKNQEISHFTQILLTYTNSTEKLNEWDKSDKECMIRSLPSKLA